MRTLAPVTALGLLGCVQPEADLGTTAGTSFDELRAAAAAHREPGTGAYIVDGDIAIHGDEALRRYWASSQQGALTIYAVGGADVRWSDARKRNLTYCVSDAFGARKPVVVAALAQATADGWAKFADVQFVHEKHLDAACTALLEGVVFDVRPVGSEGQYLARAFFPDQPRAERSVLVDASAFDAVWPLANIVAHELGHVLGFRHEHVRAPGTPCPEGGAYRGITAYDAASVMHYPHCGGTSHSLAFTPLDQEGAASVYGLPGAPNPPPMAAINAPKHGDVVPPAFAVEASLLDQDLVKGELVIDGALVQTLTAAPFTFEVAGLAEGDHDLLVTATDAAGQRASQAIRITVKPPEDDPGGGAGTDTTGDAGGGCSTGGAPTGAAALAGLTGLGLAGALRRRRRRQPNG